MQRGVILYNSNNKEKGKNTMKDIIVRLTVIKGLAKDIHYNACGEGFYGTHLLMDRVADGLDDFIDDINENLYLGRGQRPPLSGEIAKLAGSMTPDLYAADNSSMLETLLGFIIGTLENISELVAEKRDFRNGDIALLDDISKDLRKKLGLVVCQARQNL